ncbi:FAD-dependent oxidoreductase [Streptomyces wuyuanensis]|uniref:NAD(P)-binding Rossmann-like domain-containing protein n=1 Tax=Streptomyces wuyuanensis TaxID=1196353 RepID=A0A1G9YE72_9ACTN|nr:NAD(P)-binding Rossmann-like domain-containing protein [Streptomyces wuyuanensis]
MASDSMNVNIDICRIWGFMEHVEVAVIGGGQSGLAAAYALCERGLKPVVLEASEEAGRLLAALLRRPHPLLPGEMQLSAWNALRS